MLTNSDSEVATMQQRNGSEGDTMAFIMAAILAILLLAYLIYAMFNPEKFQ
jgi:K+-transporting ATPase KdpF subunit